MPRKSKYTTDSFLKELFKIRKKHKNVPSLHIAQGIVAFMDGESISFDDLVMSCIVSKTSCATPCKQIQERDGWNDKSVWKVAFKKPRKTVKKKPGRPRKQAIIVPKGITIAS